VKEGELFFFQWFGRRKHEAGTKNEGTRNLHYVGEQVVLYPFGILFVKLRVCGKYKTLYTSTNCLRNVLIYPVINLRPTSYLCASASLREELFSGAGLAIRTFLRSAVLFTFFLCRRKMYFDVTVLNTTK